MNSKSPKPKLYITLAAALMIAPFGLHAADTKTTSHNLDHDLNKTGEASHTHVTTANSSGVGGKTTSHNTNVESSNQKDNVSANTQFHYLTAPTPGDNAK